MPSTPGTMQVFLLLLTLKPLQVFGVLFLLLLVIFYLGLCLYRKDMTILAGRPKPETRTPKPETRNPGPETRNPKPETRNPKPETRSPKPETRNPKL